MMEPEVIGGIQVQGEGGGGGGGGGGGEQGAKAAELRHNSICSNYDTEIQFQ